jgi:hypothetical protein
MSAIKDPYFRKAVEFAELAEKAKDAQGRTNYTILADCYRRLSRRVAAIASPTQSEVEGRASSMAEK